MSICIKTVKCLVYSVIISCIMFVLVQVIIPNIKPNGILIEGQRNMTVRAGNRLYYTIFVTNLSPKPTYLSVLPTCACTVTDTMREKIAWYVRKKISINVNTKEMKPGLHKKSVIFFFERHEKSWHQSEEIQFVVR